MKEDGPIMDKVSMFPCTALNRALDLYPYCN